MNDKIDFIRQKCIEANPDIVTLKFGCEVEAVNWGENDDGRRFVLAEMAICNRHKKYREECYDDDRCNPTDGFAVIRTSEEGFWYERFLPSEIKAIGRPIRLADVLLVLQGMPDYEHYVPNVDCVGFFRAETGVVIGNENADMRWNLRSDDLSEQSEETINFLYDLLQ